MPIADLYAAIVADLDLDAEFAGCPECDAQLRPRVGTDVQAVEPVLESLRGPLCRSYLSRVFTPDEIADSGWRNGADPTVAAESLAARFAVKEAVVKILRPEGLDGAPRPPWTDIEIRRNVGGRPSLSLWGAAATQARIARLTSWTCSLAHDAGWAVATVVALEYRTQSWHTPRTPREVHHAHR